MTAASAPPTTTIGSRAPNAENSTGTPMSPAVADASELMIDPTTVRKTLPNTTKNAAPITTGTTVAADPNGLPTIPLCRRR